MSDDKKDIVEDDKDEQAPEEEAVSSSPEESDASDADESKDEAASSEEEEEEEEEEEDEDEDEEEEEEKEEDEEEEKEEEEDEEEEKEEEEDEDEEEEEEEEEDEDEDEEEEEEEDSHDDHGHGHDDHGHGDPSVLGVAAFFDHPDHLIYAAAQARDAEFEVFDAFSPFPIHGMDDAMGLGRSWIPWVTFLAGATGFTIANGMEFGIMAYDWPMIFGGKPYAAWPSFVPIMFELTVLLAGVTTALVMLYAAGCFRRPLIIDPQITTDRFVLWISSADDRFDRDAVITFMKGLNPMEIRTVRKQGGS